MFVGLHTQKKQGNKKMIDNLPKDNEKQCLRCKAVKDKSEFTTRGKNNLMCKECRKLRRQSRGKALHSSQLMRSEDLT